jgi:Flp pilus assembly protein TadB
MSTNEKLEKTVREKPYLQHVLDLRLVLRSAALAVVAALVMWLLVGPATAGFMLLLVFFGSWFVLARASYDRRRESREADDERSDSQPAGAT